MTVVQPPTSTDAASATCLSCGAPLASDQRYCLACGHPSSPVRLAFLDVLGAEHERSLGGQASASQVLAAAPLGYGPAYEPPDGVGRLRRYSGLFGLLSVLLLAVIVGLLVGHWVSAAKTPAKSVLEVKGLSGLAAGAATPVAAAPTATPAASTPASTKASGAKTTKAAKSEAASEIAATKALPPAPVKASAKTLSKLSNANGKQHAQEINKLTEGGKPIETGGG